MRGNASRLHAHDLAILVERRQRDECTQQNREWHEAGDKLRDTERRITPKFGIAVARLRKDFSALAEEVEHHQDENEARQHRETAGEEGLGEIDREPR